MSKHAVQAVLLNNHNQILCVSRKDDHNDFGLVGGKVEEGESIEDALVREVKEESGLDVTRYRLIHAAHMYGRMQYTYLCDWTGFIHTSEDHVAKWGDFTEVQVGSFGEYNKMVLDSLIDMGTLMKPPKNKDIIKFEWSYTIDPYFKGNQKNWNQTILNVFNKAIDVENPKVPAGELELEDHDVEEFLVPIKFKNIIESLNGYLYIDDLDIHSIGNLYRIQFTLGDTDLIRSKSDRFFIQITNKENFDPYKKY
jgi:8-oxo-dGTP pyrophosphatase MutT (NUDIX family)